MLTTDGILDLMEYYPADQTVYLNKKICSGYKDSSNSNPVHIFTASFIIGKFHFDRISHVLVKSHFRVITK